MNEQLKLFDDPEPSDEGDSSFLPLSDTRIMVTVGVRETFGLAYKDADRVSYAESAAVCQTMLPELFTDDTTFSSSQVADNIQVGLYEQRAEAQSKMRNTKITPLMLIDEDIAIKDKEINANPDGNALKAERKKLLRIREKLKKSSYNEREVLEWDMYQVRRDLPVSHQGRGYIEFVLPHHHALRMRLFHPDKPEHVTGVDVVYEHLSDKEDLARIAAMQYKMLENGILSLPSQKELARFERQLNRMERTFCNASPSYCQAQEKNKAERWYCQHYCSVFIRPTDRLQKADAKYISTGYHIPVCRFRHLWNASPKKRLPVVNFQSQSIKSEAFEELFNLNELGSDWITYQELEEFYQKHKVLDPSDRIVIHAQEFTRT